MGNLALFQSCAKIDISYYPRPQAWHPIIFSIAYAYSSSSNTALVFHNLELVGEVDSPV